MFFLLACQFPVSPLLAVPSIVSLESEESGAVDGTPTGGEAELKGDVPAPKDVPLENPPAPEVQEAVQQVQDLNVRASAIAHYLADLQAAQQGLVPKGWVQPSYDEYLKPGAPPSFLPGVALPTP